MSNGVALIPNNIATASTVRRRYALWLPLVTGDGQRFLVTTPTFEAGLTPITVLMNWEPK